MPLYLIAYDLQQHPESALEALIKSLENADAFPALPSVWFLNSPYSAQPKLPRIRLSAPVTRGRFTDGYLRRSGQFAKFGHQRLAGRFGF